MARTFLHGNNDKYCLNIADQSSNYILVSQLQQTTPEFSGALKTQILTLRGRICWLSAISQVLRIDIQPRALDYQ